MKSVSRCAQCGQVDDHPKVHYGEGMTGGLINSWHLDCLPYAVEQELREQHGDSIDAAKSGVHGDDLREFQIAKTASASLTSSEGE